MFNFTRIPSLLLSLTTIIRFATPTIEKSEWKELSDSLKQKLSPLHHHISRCNNPDDLKVLGDHCTCVIREFLIEHPELFEDDTKQHSKFQKHSDKTLKELQTLKKKLRKEAFGNGGSPDKIRQFHECLKAISDYKKREKKKTESKTTLFQEKLFNKNRWHFSRQAVKGTLGLDIKEPSFSKPDADRFYPQTYSIPREINLPDLHWFPDLPTSPNSEDFEPFNSEPIKPKDVKKVLSNCNLKSAPGPDGIP